jgi:predicted nucleotidyltransferase
VDEDVLRQLRTYFEAHPAGLAAVYLYGSIARGDAHAGSDVDVGVLFAGDPPSTFVAQPYELEAALEDRIRRPVQVVILNRAPVDLRARVLRDGEIVFEPDRAGRIRFEVQTRNEAFDLEPILRRYRMPR